MIEKQSLIKIDMHVHTSYSYDSELTPSQLVTTYLAKGINGLVVADHNEIKGTHEVRKIAPFPVIIAEEIDTPEGEMISLFIRKKF